jgi:eukaryotic-like serine/threonine-protein kinase
VSTPLPTFVPPDYVIQRKLGSGQTSHVFLAQHTRLGSIALKLPRDELHTQPVLRRMFESEVQITLSLKHNHIVRALDGFPTGARAFLSLEYCSGGTLDNLLLERGRLPLQQASQLVCDVALGLAATHKQQVLHRDVKPANVFLTEKGRAKLGDFGTGIFISDRKRLDERVGTAFYMAPELFHGQPSHVMSDVYSLGVLAYEVLTGERPFQGDSYEELMLQHTSALPRNLNVVRADIPKRLSNIVMQAMARDPEKRFSSVQQFLDAYQEAAGISLQEEEPPRVGRAARKSDSDNQRPVPTKKQGFLSRLFGKKR